MKNLIYISIYNIYIYIYIYIYISGNISCNNETKKELIRVKSYSIFSDDLLAIEMKKKTQTLKNKLVSLCLSILEISRILMHAF